MRHSAGDAAITGIRVSLDYTKDGRAISISCCDRQACCPAASLCRAQDVMWVTATDVPCSVFACVGCCLLDTTASISPKLQVRTSPSFLCVCVCVCVCVTYCPDSVRLWRLCGIRSTYDFVARHVCTYWQERKRLNRSRCRLGC